MNTLTLLLFATAALGGAVFASLWCQWRASRSLARLQALLAQSEQSRQAAVERSDQARIQVGQLSRALADLQMARKRLAAEAHPPATPKVPSLAEPATLVLPRREMPKAFADTQVM
jgi:hypothetical protein